MDKFVIIEFLDYKIIYKIINDVFTIYKSKIITDSDYDLDKEFGYSYLIIYDLRSICFLLKLRQSNSLHGVNNANRIYDILINETTRIQFLKGQLIVNAELTQLF